MDAPLALTLILVKLASLNSTTILFPSSVSKYVEMVRDLTFNAMMATMILMMDVEFLAILSQGLFAVEVHLTLLTIVSFTPLQVWLWSRQVRFATIQRSLWILKLIISLFHSSNLLIALTGAHRSWLARWPAKPPPGSKQDTFLDLDMPFQWN